MSTLSPADLALLLEAHPGLPLFDVRTPGEFRSVHIPQARNLPLDRLNPDAVAAAGVSLETPIYLLCASGRRARQAAEEFRLGGFRHPVVIEGGITAWEKAGLPVTRSAGGVISLERQIRIAAGSLVVLGVVLAWLVSPLFVLLSGFVGVGLVFAGATDWCGLGLLLARLPWNRAS
ncbi:Rhodanese-related sulfurtransferase [Verrucomicrobium sp. GAS474]|uniref:rhodanese-like domain-containing protein n=1 Tax=Verrucomicrobium sp. GAS474 TaxID=1882831 RepID=UPI00087A4EEF|nr:rhodanese-like domain-containing protein [Verrucomicrobium sp. GAS474]SDU12345.1 Rhodanese-related sulfurtransferase [Verrucomicrobium sp. GAS474]